MGLAARFVDMDFDPDQVEHTLNLIYPTDETTHIRLVKPPKADFIRVEYGTLEGSAQVFWVRHCEDIPLACYDLQRIVAQGYWHVGEVHRLINILRLASLYDLTPEGRIILPKKVSV